MLSRDEVPPTVRNIRDMLSNVIEMGYADVPCFIGRTIEGEKVELSVVNHAGVVQAKSPVSVNDYIHREFFVVSSDKKVVDFFQAE